MSTLYLIFFLLPICYISATTEKDCWDNEVFVECGQCEGTCWEPVIKCSKHCKPARCECPLSRGYVRTKHGHCTKITDCPGPSLYSENTDPRTKVAKEDGNVEFKRHTPMHPHLSQKKFQAPTAFRQFQLSPQGNFRYYGRMH